MKKIISTTIICCLFCVQLIGQQLFNILNFGAVADGKTINTKAIQQAIDSCGNIGGGTVLIPSGVFITGSLEMRSHINLHLSAGSVLKGSSQLIDYQLNGKLKGIIFGEDLTDISITGEGEINGNSPAFFDEKKLHIYIDFDKKFIRQGQAFFDSVKPADGPIYYKERPNMTVILMHCENIKLSGIHFVDAPSWTIRLGNCDGIIVDGISIKNNPLVPNSDGLHMTLSRNARVSNCNILAGDDAIIVTGFGEEIDVHNAANKSANRVFKYGNKVGVAENIVVTNSVLQSLCAGIRVGYGKGNMRNLIFSNIIIHQSNRGILINAREEGSVDNILFDNFIIDTKHLGGTWWGRGEPIHISSFPISKGLNNGTISNVRFNNIHIVAETGIVVWANEMGKVRDLVFDNMSLKINNSPYIAAFGGNIDLRPTPDFSTNLFKRNLPAFLFHNIEQVKIKGVSNVFTGIAPDFYTYGLEVEGSKNFVITESRFASASYKYIPVLINQSTNMEFKNSAPNKIYKTLK
jgi:polygalacturonase